MIDRLENHSHETLTIVSIEPFDEVGGERFEHFTGAGVQLKVKEDASSPRLRSIQRVCADRVEALR
jgi:hypothetical protein